MKNSVLFKSLIDIFFFIHVIGLIAILSKFPLQFFDAKNMEAPQFWDWVNWAINTFIYFIFLRGLFFLRKIARIFLSQNHFPKPVVNYMKICGNQFVYAGLISFVLSLTNRFFDFYFEPIYKSFSITPVFLIIVGLFFAIQSRTLSHAISLKNENDLMV